VSLVQSSRRWLALTQERAKMLLITETNDDLKFIAEASGDGKKNYKIRGIFMETETKNRNGRVYRKANLFPEVQRYIQKYVDFGRALGELGHPEGPTLNLERVAHKITGLKFDGNNIIGEAKILDTPYGNIVKNLMDEGVKLGVSSRGMGSLKEINGVNEVQGDYVLSAVDIVADPSAPNAFVDGIMEGKQWVWDNGILKEMKIDAYRKAIKKTPVARLDEEKLRIFKDFMSNL